MFVANVYALRAIDLLHFFNQVLLYCLPAHDAQNVLRVNGTIDKLASSFHLLARFNANVAPRRDDIFSLFISLVADVEVSVINDYITGNSRYHRMFFHNCRLLASS